MLAHQPAHLDLPGDLDSWMSANQPCPRCGGSGMLRLDGQRSCTCLPCLGQGRIRRLRPATTTAALLQPDVPDSAPISAPASSAAR